MSYDDCVYLKEGLIEPIKEVIGRERGGGNRKGRLISADQYPAELCSPQSLLMM